MRTTEAIKTLAEWDRQGRIVFTLSDLRKMFPHQSDKTLSESLRRLVFNGLLERAANGVYVNPLSTRSRADLLEEVALALRRGEYNYLSLECALSEWGVISQDPQSYLTVMTTGRKGTFNTPYGIVEFTHTRRTGSEIIHRTVRGIGRCVLPRLRVLGRISGALDETSTLWTLENCRSALRRKEKRIERGALV